MQNVNQLADNLQKVSQKLKNQVLTSAFEKLNYSEQAIMLLKKPSFWSRGLKLQLHICNQYLHPKKYQDALPH